MLHLDLASSVEGLTGKYDSREMRQRHGKLGVSKAEWSAWDSKTRHLPALLTFL
jgi:truncated hemoglobin YjbI